MHTITSKSFRLSSDFEADASKSEESLNDFRDALPPQNYWKSTIYFYLF